MHHLGLRLRTGMALLLMPAALWWGDASISPAAAPRRRISPRERIQQDHTELAAQFTADLTALAEFCDEHDFAADAEHLRLLAAPFAQQTLDVDALPEYKQPSLPGTLPPEELAWRTQLRSLQSQYGKDLYVLSQRAVREKLASAAFDFIREAAFHDPDHRMARKALGYVPVDDGWATPFVAERRRAGFVWDDRFGWLPQAHVARYAQGERHVDGEWMSAEKEAAIRTDFAKAWLVPTEHFEVRTNHSLERGVELAVALEDYYRFFVREFAGFFNTPQQMDKLFDAGAVGSRSAGKRHEVHFYREREEYVSRLKSKQAGIEMTSGLYLPSDQIAYFYDSPDDPEAHLETLFHEVTHQILSESGRSPVEVGRDANFWIIEGIACYMESFDRAEGRASVGDPGHNRLYWARSAIVDEQHYEPLAQFSQLNMRDFQFGAEYATLQKRYSQATGLAHFFRHARNGEYREALVTYLSQIYSPDARIRSRVQGLDRLTGVDYVELDRQYQEYIRALPVTEP